MEAAQSSWRAEARRPRLCLNEPKAWMATFVGRTGANSGSEPDSQQRYQTQQRPKPRQTVKYRLFLRAMNGEVMQAVQQTMHAVKQKQQDHHEQEQLADGILREG